MKKIAYIVHGLPCGGVETVLKSFVEKMSQHFEIHLILATKELEQTNQSLEWFSERIGREAIQHTGLINSPIRLLKYTKKLYSILKVQKYDIVHSHMMLFNGINLAVAFFAGVKRRVAHSHGSKSSAEIEQNRKFFGRLLANMFRVFMIFVLSIFSTDLLGVSKDACKFSYGKSMAKSKRCKVLLNPCEVPKLLTEKEKEEFLKTENIDVHKKNVLIYGRLAASKNLLFTADIINCIVNERKRKDIFFHFVGSGRMEDELIKYVNDNALDDNVRFYHWRTDGIYFLQTSDLLLTTSKSEGLGLTLIEAQLSRLNCIAFDTLPEETDLGKMIKMSFDSTVADWADRICDYFDESNKSLELDLEKAEKFDEKVICGKLLEIYNQGMSD